MDKQDKQAIVSKTTSELLKDTFISMTEGITGLASSKKEQLILSAGHLLQRLRSIGLIDSLRQEWNVYRDKGRIAEDYQYTEQHLNCLQELLDFFDKEIPDEVRFSILKKILLVAAQEITTDRNSLLPAQFMRLCKSMSSGEALVLLTTHNIAKIGAYDNKEHYGAIKWLEVVAEHSGLVFPELVNSFETELIKKYLISDRTHVDRSGVNVGSYFRLTNLGRMFCEYIDKHEALAVDS